MRRPLVWVAAAFLLGVAGQGLWPAWTWWLMTTTALVAISRIIRRGQTPLGLTPLVLVAVAGLGALTAAADRRAPAGHVCWDLAGGPVVGVIEGVVVDDPAWRAMPERPVTQETTVALLALNGQRAAGRVWLRHRQPAYPLRYGDRVQIRGTIRPPRRAEAPGAFDEARWLWPQSIDGVLEASRDDVEWLAPARGWRRGLRALFDLKHRALGMMAQRVDPLTAALLGTLLAGERTALPRHVTAAFTDTGTVHLLSVSGWHVTLIGGLCWGAARLALPRRGAAVATMAGLLAYGVLAGAQPPIVRATVAGLVVLAGLCLTRPADPLNTLALAALLIVAAAPRTIWMPAFQLSVVSVLALLTLAPLGMAAIRRCGLGMVQNPSLGLRLARGVLQSLVISTAAWLGTWPLVAYHLHRVSLVSGPANLVAVPVAALVMVTGLVVVVGGLIHAWIVWPWVGAVQLATHGLVAGLAWCARWPGAAIACPAPPVWMVLGWYLALAGAARGVNNIYKLYPEPEDA